MKKVGETYGRLTIEAKDEKRSKEKKKPIGCVLVPVVILN